jgi:acyl-CoA synthetase (NDP forming)
VVTRQALFEQAGVIAAGSLGELLDAVALLATQPVPAGRTVAIVSNIGGAGVLAADACTEHGLAVHATGGSTRRKLRAIAPPGAALTGPVDTTAAVTTDQFRRCLEILAADEGVDAVLALVLPTAATGDLLAAIQHADVRAPLAAVALGRSRARPQSCSATAAPPQPTWPRCGRSCCASPVSPTTSPRWPNSTSPRSSPAPTG